MDDWRKTSGIKHNQRLFVLFKSGLGNPYDVTFVVGPAKEEVNAHQFILRLHSPVFEHKFKKENKAFPIVSIEDGNKQDFEQFLQILYTGVMCDQPNQATKLLKYAVAFQVWDLEEWCWKSLEQITEESAVTVYEFAIKFGKNSLRDQALQFILSNARTILESDEFLKFTSHNLFKVLSSDELAATNETQVFKAVLRWGKEMCKRDGVQPTGAVLRNVLTDLLPMVRFPVMSKSDFSMLVAPLELLTDKELISILLYFNIDKNKRNDIPPGAFNGKERTWFKKRKSGQEHVLHRLVPLPNDPALRKQFLEQNGSSYIKLTATDFVERNHQLKFCVDHAIWITSIGVNAGSQVPRIEGSILAKPPQITFEAEITDTEVEDVWGTKVRTVGVAQLDKTFQLHLCKPVPVEAGRWYTLGFTIVEGVYKPKLYQSAMGCDGKNKSITVEGKTINFRFEEVPGQNPAVIGLTQGFIPTIGFKLEGPKCSVSHRYSPREYRRFQGLRPLKC